MSKHIRIMSVVLAVFAFFFFCCGPLAASAQAVIVLDDAIIAILIAAIASCGITLVATGGFSNLKDYTAELFNEFCQSQGKAPSEVLRGCQSGTNKFGQVILNNRFVLVIDTFVKWIQNKFSLTDNSTQEIVVPGATLSDLQLYGLPIYLESDTVNDREWILISSTKPVYALLYFHYNDTSGFDVMAISEEVATVRIIQIRSNGTIVGSGNDHDLVYNGEYGLYYYANGYLTSNYDISDYAVYSYETALGALESNADIDVNNIGITAQTGSICAPTDDPEYTDGDGAILDVNGDWGITYEDVVSNVIPDEYEESSLTFEEEETLQDQVEESQAQSVSSNANDYAGPSLVTVFPFCIPFDIYDFLDCLAADPVSPSFQWRFYVPGIVDETITIDLSPFDTVAQIVRTMELLLFCVGLAFVTRKLIRG